MRNCGKDALKKKKNGYPRTGGDLRLLSVSGCTFYNAFLIVFIDDASSVNKNYIGLIVFAQGGGMADWIGYKWLAARYGIDTVQAPPVTSEIGPRDEPSTTITLPVKFTRQTCVRKAPWPHTDLCD